MTRGIKGDSNIGDETEASVTRGIQGTAALVTRGIQGTGASVTRGDRSIGDQRDRGDTEEPAGSRASQAQRTSHRGGACDTGHGQAVPEAVTVPSRTRAAESPPPAPR